MAHTVKGSCLCGTVSFRLTGELPPVYQCHCSLCRKVSGSSSNSALVIEAEHFTWTSGEDQVGSFVTATGFRSDFCRRCGCPVPNVTANGLSFWIPAGLLEEPIDSQVGAHVYVTSRASWDTAFSNDSVRKFSAMPSREEWSSLCQQLQKNRPTGDDS